MGCYLARPITDKDVHNVADKGFSSKIYTVHVNFKPSTPWYNPALIQQ